MAFYFPRRYTAQNLKSLVSVLEINRRELEGYLNQLLPLVGGIMTGEIVFSTGTNASLSWNHPTSGNAALAWEDDYLRFRFGGTSTPLGIRIDDYDNENLELSRYGDVREVRELNFQDFVELTLNASGAITVTQSYHRVDTYQDASSDILLTINGGSPGSLLILMAAHDDRTVQIQEGGNILLAGGGPMTLDAIRDTIMLLRGTSSWIQLAFSNNG